MSALFPRRKHTIPAYHPIALQLEPKFEDSDGKGLSCLNTPQFLQVRWEECK